MTKTYHFVEITARDYFSDGTYEEYTAILNANDKIGINNFGIHADEIVRFRRFSETKKVNLIEWLRG